MDAASAPFGNQSPPFADVNLFSSDNALRDSLSLCGVDAQASDLCAFGAACGSAESLELRRPGNQHPPVLHALDSRGERADIVEFHPAWNELMRRSMAAG